MEKNKTNAFIEKFFWGVIAAIGTLLTGLCSQGVIALIDLSKSTVSLNEKMGFVVEKIKLHDDELKEHDREIYSLKTRMQK